MLKEKGMGIDADPEEMRIRRALLERMLSGYDDGLHDVFLCPAENMPDPGDPEAAMRPADGECPHGTARKKAARPEKLLRRCADEKNIPLVLRG